MFDSFFIAAFIFIVGMAASFFFSGTEIGYYRVSRAKLVLDSLLGCWRSRFLLWLTNHPPVFISTVLLGNNLANYGVSLGSVLLFQYFFPDSSAALLSTVVASPFVFIYGELLPKSVFLQAPTRLMRQVMPVYVVLVFLFMPVSLLLSGLNRLLAWLLGETSRTYALQMTDSELQLLLGEGKSVGILQKSQHAIAEKIFKFRSVALETRMVSLKQFPTVNEKMTRAEMIQKARKTGSDWILTQAQTAAGKKNRPIGFYFFSDLLLSAEKEPVPYRKLLEIPTSVSYPEAMGRMLTADVPFAVLISAQGEYLGILPRDEY